MSAETPTPSRATRPFRIAADLGEKLDDLLEYLDLNSAEYIDPLVRRQIENDHASNLPGIKAMREARERAARQRDEIPELQNELGEAGA